MFSVSTYANIDPAAISPSGVPTGAVISLGNSGTPIPSSSSSLPDGISGTPSTNVGTLPSGFDVPDVYDPNTGATAVAPTAGYAAVPVDGGISLLLLAGAGLGVRRMRKNLSKKM